MDYLTLKKCCKNERWKPYPTHSAYIVSTCGRVWTTFRSRLVNTFLNTDGYPRMVMASGRCGHGKNKDIYRLVLETFVSPKPAGKEARHLDNVRTNHHLSNLIWATHAENMADQVKFGTSTQGIKHPMVKLTEAEVLEMRRLRKEGMPPQRDRGLVWSKC